jgi:hypothetical protein
MSGAFDCKTFSDRTSRMFKRPHSDGAATRMAHRATGACHGPGFQLLRAENLEGICAAASQGICADLAWAAWAILSLEQREAYELQEQDRRDRSV